MSHFKIIVTALGAALLVVACGGGGQGAAPKVKFTSMVSFGDSLSDVGTYKVGKVAALGGGLYSVNGINGAVRSEPTPSKNWTELVAAQIGVAPPCAAQTGPDGDVNNGFSVSVVDHPGCSGYAQGGARVSNPVGPHNKVLNPTLGLLTVPVVTQIANHLNRTGGRFSGTELVTIMAGANDVLVNLRTIAPTVAYLMSPAGGSLDQATATTQASTAAVTAVGVAGAELATYIKTSIVGKGANYVALLNVPDISKTPLAYTLDAPTQGLINVMVNTFNTQLQTDLAGTAGVIVIDAYADHRNQVANPASYALTNVTTPACDLTTLSTNELASALVCTVGSTSATPQVGSNVIAGDISHYLFADDVHPTPYGYQLIAQLATKGLVAAGWV